MRLIGQSGLKFAHDALFGAGAGCFEEILQNTNCTVTTINGRHDPLFGGINPEPIEKNCRLGAAFLQKNPHDFCLVTDGDADRIGAMDGKGNYLSAHQVICLVLYHLHKHKQLTGTFIKAISTTAMTEDMCRDYGCPVIEVPIGFKHVVPEITKPGALMAGEESGSLGFHNHIPERDGMLAGLFILEMLALEKRPLTEILGEIEAKYGKRYYRRIDAQFPLNKTKALLADFKSNPPEKLNYTDANTKAQTLVLEKVNTLDGVKYLFNNNGWLLLRTSGTEPIIRLYAEARTPEALEAILAYGEAKAKANGTVD
jgi:phosphomannomutase